MQLQQNVNGIENNQNILNQYLDIIFDKEIWREKEVYKIAEVTYSYKSEFPEGDYKDGYHFNITLLTSIGGLKHEDFKDASPKGKINLLKRANENIKNILRNKIEQIEKALIELKNLDDLNEFTNENERKIFKLQKNILIKSLEYNKKLIEQALFGLVFELEKAGLNHNLSKKEIEARIKEIDKIDEELFGGNIKNNTQEIIRTYERLRTKIEEAGKLSQFKKELNAIEKLLPEGYEFKKYQEPKKVTFKKIDIDNSNIDLVEILNRYIQSQDIDYLAILDDKVENITDDIESLKVPTKKLTYKLIIAIKRIVHEIDAHTLNLKNGIKLIGMLRGANNLIKEEGLAMLLEYLFEYGENAYKINSKGEKKIDIDKIDIGQYYPKYLLAEILASDKVVDFIKKYEVIEKDSSSTALARLLRMKRNRPLNHKGHQCKDMAYIRGMFEIVNYINSGKDPKNLFLGKVGLEDIDQLIEIKELKEQNGEFLDLNEPVFMYEQIYFKILQKFGDKKYRKMNFLDYLENKYPLLDFREEKIKSVKKETKYLVLKIINIFIENIETEKFSKRNNKINKKIKEAA